MYDGCTRVQATPRALAALFCGMDKKPLKDKALSIRLPAELKDQIDADAQRLGLSTSQLVERLLETYAEARSTHGHRLIYPPEFVHFLDGTTNQE